MSATPSRPGLRARLRGPLTQSLGATAVVQVLGVITGVLLARVLGPSARGELAAVILWPTVIVAAGSTGVTEAVTYFAARRVVPLPTLAATAVRLALLLGLALAIVGVVVVTFALGGQRPSVRSDGYLYLLNVPPALFALGVMYLLNGVQRFAWFNVLRVVVFVGTTVGIVALAAAGALTVASATIAYLGATVVTAMAAAVALRRVVGRLGSFSRSVARSVLAFGIKGQLSTVSNVLNERVDQLVISVALAPAKLGLYVVAATLVSPAWLVGQSVALTALPVVAGYEPGKEQARSARRYVGLAVAGTTLIALPIAVAAPTLIELFFGPGFAAAGDSARVLALASIALGAGRVLGAVLKAVGRPLDAGTAETVGLVVTGVGLAVLLPASGILGAAITSALAYSSTVAYAVWRAARALGTGRMWLLMPTRATFAEPLRILLGRRS